jgi:TolB protein
MRKLIVSLVTNLICLMAASNAWAVLKIDITQGNVDPMPIAISNLLDDSGENTSLGNDIREVIENDLKSSGLFRPISQNAFLEKLKVEQVPNFANWRQIGAMALTSARLYKNGNQLTCEYRIWDPNVEGQIGGSSITIGEKNWRRLAHKIADEIYQKITGEQGYFDTRIAFISETGPATKRVKKLALMDQDGSGYRELTSGKFMVLTPRFDSKLHKVIYMSYEKRVPQVYILDIHSGDETLVGKFPGMSFSPRFAPDGNYAIFSIAKGGTTDIYEINLNNSSLNKLTNLAGSISTSPSYAPDGNQIVFTSDRGGSTQLYVMNRDGSQSHRISFGEGSYTTPVWSPRGDYIAFTKQKGGVFYIGVMRPDGSGERLLTSSWMDEGPTWAPNGRVIMFSRQARGSGYKVFAIDITGYNERIIKTPHDASDPAWSPLLN